MLARAHVRPSRVQVLECRYRTARKLATALAPNVGCSQAHPRPAHARECLPASRRAALWQVFDLPVAHPEHGRECLSAWMIAAQARDRSAWNPAHAASVFPG
jgi:hypothetical protein